MDYRVRVPRGYSYCINCGRIIPSDSVKCPYCGDYRVRVPPGYSYCIRCSRMLPSNSVRCPYCGAKLESA